MSDALPAWMAKNKELETLWNAVVYHTQGDLFWIGEILLNEITKETGYHPRNALGQSTSQKQED